MKRTILATCLAGVCAVGLSAQTPTQQPPTQPPTGTAGTSGAASDQDRAREVKVTGCLKEEAGTFTLTNVKGMGRPAGTTGDTAGAPSTTGGAATTAPEGGSSAKGTQVTLLPAADVDLKAHVGHQIEVTGKPATGAGAGSTAGGTTAGGTTAGGTTAGGTGTTATSGRARSLNVTNVKMIAASCSE